MPATLPYTQESFDGGMNLIDSDTKLAPNQYKVGFNMRARFGDIEPVVKPTMVMSGLPASIILIQGFYSFGSLLVLFADGLAYYKTSSSNVWVNIAGFLMSAEIDRIYAVGVPASSLLYNRASIPDVIDSTIDPSAPIKLLIDVTAASPIALVCQDGVNQPRLIFSDGTTRLAKTYGQWALADREYVPIGLQMMFFNNILFVVSPDGKNIYRSVSGRPLDFVVAIDGNADKISDAVNTSHAIDNNTIRLIQPLNADSFVVFSSYTATSVKLDKDNLLFGEPRFINTFLFTAGVVNQFCLTDLLGDFAFIDYEGLKSFNAVLQLNNEGNNGVLSLSVAKLFKNIKQTDPCIGSFDNYILFGVKTIYSPSSILIYDTLSKAFISVDILTGVTRQIRQFAAVYTESVQKFYVATTDQIFELYSKEETTNYENVTLFTRAFNCKNSDLGPMSNSFTIRSNRVKLLFEGSSLEGEVQLTQIVDNALDKDNDNVTRRYQNTITPYTTSYPYPLFFPVLGTVLNDANNFSIPTDGAREGNKIANVLVWTGGGRLKYLNQEAITNSSLATLNQQNKIYA